MSNFPPYLLLLKPIAVIKNEHRREFSPMAHMLVGDKIDSSKCFPPFALGVYKKGLPVNSNKKETDIYYSQYYIHSEGNRVAINKDNLREYISTGVMLIPNRVEVKLINLLKLINGN